MTDDLMARFRDVLLKVSGPEWVRSTPKLTGDVYFVPVGIAAAAMARAVDILAQELQYDVAIEAALAAARGEDR